MSSINEGPFLVRNLSPISEERFGENGEIDSDASQETATTAQDHFNCLRRCIDRLRRVFNTPGGSLTVSNDEFSVSSMASFDTVSGPSAPPSSPDLTFQSFDLIRATMAPTVPNWVQTQHLRVDPFQNMYNSSYNRNGQLTTTRRMDCWLTTLPRPRHEAGAVEGPRTHTVLLACCRDHFSAQLASWEPCPTEHGRRQQTRPQSVSAPPSPICHFPTAPLVPLSLGLASPLPLTVGELSAPTTTTIPVAAPQPNIMSDSSAGSQHPNPLGLHPATQPLIPLRRSSRFFDDSTAYDVDRTNSPAGNAFAAAVEETLVRRIQSLQIEDCVSARDQTSRIYLQPTLRHETRRVEARAAVAQDQNRAFEMDGREEQVERQFRKRARSITRTATVASQQPAAKRLRRTLTNARNRLSRVMDPGSDDEADEPHQNRLANLTRVSERTTLASSTKPGMFQVTGFGVDVAKERVKIAFIGNAGVGKTTFINAFRNVQYGDAISAEAIDKFACGCEVDTVNVVLDGVPVACEIWDVSSKYTDSNSEAHAMSPLLVTFHDLVVICHDISDETSLTAAEAKWAHFAERYCTGASTILLGLKADLRKPYPTLRLAHLFEPTQSSLAQAQKLGKRIGAEASYEASGEMREHVAAFFETNIRFALLRRGGLAEAPGRIGRAKKVWQGLKKYLK